MSHRCSRSLFGVGWSQGVRTTGVHIAYWAPTRVVALPTDGYDMAARGGSEP